MLFAAFLGLVRAADEAAPGHKALATLTWPSSLFTF